MAEEKTGTHGCTGDPSLEKLPVYILSGGRSSRFGTDKARALLESEPLLRWVVKPLQARAAHLTVVAEVPDKYEDLGFRTLGDRVRDLGPLGGLITALHDLDSLKETGWLFLCSCDFVGARSQWVDELLSHRRPGADAVVFRGERWEPLFALYHTSILESVAAALACGQRAVRCVLESARTVEVPLPGDWGVASSVNTHEALDECSKKIRSEM